MALIDRDGGRARFVVGLGIGALALALYWPIRGHEWLRWDDFTYITQNPHIQLGISLEGLRWTLSFHEANWFPITWLSWMLDYDLYGFEAGAFLTTNLVLHAVDSALLFAALAKLTGSTGRSAFVAAVFAVHPLHVESVAWAAARKDVLSGLFWMLALWLQSGVDPSRSRRLLVAGCFAMGFAAKPTVVALPFVLLLLDDWPLGRTRRADRPERWDPLRVRRVLVERAPLMALGLVFAVVTVAAQHSRGTVQNLQALPVGMRIENALVSTVAYLGDAFWPSGLAFFYPHPGDSIPGWEIATAASALCLISAAAISQARARPYLAVGWLWYLVTLLPVIGLVQVGAQARADRYMYLPLIGLAIAVAWGVPELLRGVRARRVLLATTACASIAVLTVCSINQIRYWRDSVTLLERGLQVTRDNHVAHAHLGGAYLELGRTADSIEQFEAALRISPDYTEVANNLAWVLATSPDDALRDPARAVELARLAVALAGAGDAKIMDTLGVALASRGRFAEALETTRRAVAFAIEAGDARLAAELRSRLGLYRDRRPYREAVPGGRQRGRR